MVKMTVVVEAAKALNVVGRDLGRHRAQARVQNPRQSHAETGYHSETSKLVESGSVQNLCAGFLCLRVGTSCMLVG